VLEGVWVYIYKATQDTTLVCTCCYIKYNKNTYNAEEYRSKKKTESLKTEMLFYGIKI